MKKILIAAVALLTLNAASFEDLETQSRFSALKIFGESMINDENFDILKDFLKERPEHLPFSDQALRLEQDHRLDAKNLQALNDAVQSKINVFLGIKQFVTSSCGQPVKKEIPIDEFDNGCYQIGSAIMSFYLAENTRDVGAENMLGEGLKSLYLHFTGQKSWVSQQLRVYQPGDTQEDSSAAYMASDNHDQQARLSDTELNEMSMKAKKISQLRWLNAVNQDITKHSMNAWDIAEAAGFFVLLEYGVSSIDCYLEEMAVKPVREKLDKLINDAHVLKDTLKYENYALSSGNPFPTSLNNEQALFHIIVSQLDDLTNCLMRGSFFILQKDCKQPYERGIKNAALAKRLYYAYMTKAATRLVSLQNGVELNEENRQQFIDDYFGHHEIYSDATYGELKKLFVQPIPVDNSLPYPNLDCWLWGELVFGYEKVEELKALLA